MHFSDSGEGQTIEIHQNKFEFFENQYFVYKKERPQKLNFIRRVMAGVTQANTNFEPGLCIPNYYFFHDIANYRKKQFYLNKLVVSIGIKLQISCNTFTCSKRLKMLPFLYLYYM